MKNRNIIAAATVGAALAVASTAQAGGVDWYSPGDDPYLSVADSPFKDFSGFTLEDFEDGLLNTPGVNLVEGNIFVHAPSFNTDSVDGDDGSIDGFGRDGYALRGASIPEGVTMTFEFTDAILPTYAGLVWTDGNEEALVTFTAWNQSGDLIGSIDATLGDGLHDGRTNSDRFFGLEVFDGAISKIQISSEFGGLNIDHLQYENYGSAVVPLPAPVAMGLAGLGAVVLSRRRKKA